MSRFFYGFFGSVVVSLFYLAFNVFAFTYADNKYIGSSVAQYLKSKGCDVDTACDDIDKNVTVTCYANQLKTKKTIDIRNLMAQGKKGAILLFWASWCPNCKDQIKALVEFGRKHPDIRCINVVSSGSATAEEAYQVLEKLLGKEGAAKIDMVYDESKACFTEFYRDQHYKVVVPMTVFVAADGAVLAKVKGKINWNEYGNVIAKCEFVKSKNLS